jgi:hypothetical protein
MGRPAMGASALPGNLEEVNRAGMTPSTLSGTIEYTTALAAERDRKPGVRDIKVEDCLAPLAGRDSRKRCIPD